MKKKILFLFLGITFTQGLWSQGITKHGEVPASSVNFVDKQGEPGSTAKLSVNGKELNVGFKCGESMTINHLPENHVAPVAKTVTYNTVLTMVFGTSKCIITKNLGASNEAVGPNDPSVEAAGWYWQYNKEQGFEHDGSTLTPTNWYGGVVIPGQDWLLENDPCNRELGSGWRIPVKSEWDNAITCDAWIGTSNTYFGGLKIHNNGRLDAVGNLVNRGGMGSLWSATNSSSSSLWALWVSLQSCNTTSIDFADGCGIRCIKDCDPPPAPTGTINQFFYPGQTVSDLKVDGTNIKWYSSSAGCTLIPNSTTLVNGTNYYASQTVADCESVERFLVAATFFNCGSNLTIEHKTSGGVAPENRSISYSTLWTLLFGENMCTINKNLGALNHASSATDESLSAAGWYWQFNRKQGYLHIGTLRTPNTAWDVTNDYSSTSWEQANDPCYNELGSGWRIPTSSEWTTAGGNWSSYQNAYNSALKLHAAGYLTETTGALSSRGMSAYFWSQDQYDDVSGYHLFLNGASSLVDSNYKSNGYSLRCIRDCDPPPAPEGPVNHIFYPGETVATLVATGTAIQWYAAASGGTPLESTTPLVDGAHYYASQTINCEGIARLDVTASLSNCEIAGLTINHLASGGVAPVDKTVHYGAVKTAIFGGEPKCVIVQNLGATYPASSEFTENENAAGWYWQFNRKQGYKHDGTTRTPNTTWITNIDEYGDWAVANDPCTIELGSGWRILTKLEWENADLQWLTIYGAYGSVLKLHTAGYLTSQDGILENRGQYGLIGNSSQYSNTFSWLLTFSAFHCFQANYPKSYGLTLRCIKD